MTISVGILAHRGDRAAAALATAVRRRGGRVAVLDDRALTRGLVHHWPDSGPADSTAGGAVDAVTAPGGGVVDATTDLVLCRLSGVTPPVFGNPKDRDYAAQELFAVALSWLHGLGPRVVNPPTPVSLVGACPDRLALQHLARRAGLRPARTRMWSNRARVRMPASAGEPPLPLPGEWVEPVGELSVALVCGDTVVGAPPGVGPAYVELVHAAGLDVAEVLIGVPGLRTPNSTTPGRGAVADEPVVLGVRPVPELRDPAHVEALARHLERRALARASVPLDVPAAEVPA